MWLVVEFLDEALVEVIPNLWVIEHNLVYWPTAKPDVLKKMILKCIKPEDNWSKCTVRILSKGKLYENYLDATNAARKAEYTSDINSDDGKRKKFPTRKQLESSNESSSDSDKENDGVIKGLPLCPASLQTTKLASLRKGQKKCAVKVVKDDIITVEEKETRKEGSSTGHNTNAIKALVTEFVKLNRKMDLLMADVSTLVILLEILVRPQMVPMCNNLVELVIWTNNFQ